MGTDLRLRGRVVSNPNDHSRHGGARHKGLHGVAIEARNVAPVDRDDLVEGLYHSEKGCWALCVCALISVSATSCLATIYCDPSPHAAGHLTLGATSVTT
jgi:hypothetical protein